MVELLSTKLFIPRLRPNLVSRPRLTGRLNASLDKKLTLIAAPAGFGKTTLLGEWIPHCPHCVTWLSLDEGDNDPTEFWAYFIASLQQLRADLGANALALLQAPQALPLSSILTGLINDLSAFPDTFSSVLDDYHAIHAQSIHDGLAFLIDHMPANMNLVLTTRVNPPLPLARLRASNHLAELRVKDLRFTAQEAADFLSRTMGLNLSAGEVDLLEARTEGWIAGLQIAALSMRGHDDLQGFIQTFSGSHRHILGYLAEEVLNQQPEDTFNFLLQTSILDRLCGPLCDAVTGGSGGQALLAGLEHTNLFLTPLDDEGRWYRYHHLFAEVLRARLHQANSHQSPELHRRAGSWFASQGMLDEAVRHMLAGEDYKEAARLIERVAGRMLRQGLSSSLARWLEAVPEEIIRANPRLCLARGWASLWGAAFSLESAEEWAQLAQTATERDPVPDLEGEIYALRSLIAADRVQPALSRELAYRALEYLPAGSPWLGVTTFCLGSALFAAGDFSAAAPILAEALRLNQADGALYTQLIAAGFLADMLASQGHPGRAGELYQQVLAWAGSGIPQKGALLAHAGLANILCEQDQLEAALAHVQLGIEQLEQVGGPGATLWLYRTLARIRQAQGNAHAALEALDRVYQSGQRAQIPFVMTQAAALRARICLAQGDLEAASEWAAGSGLDLDDPQASRPGLRETEYLSFARVLDAQGRRSEALALLDRLLKSAEAEERARSVIEILVLESRLFHSLGKPEAALERLERALALAEPECYIRSFVDEGEAVRSLLLACQAKIKKQIGKGVESESIRFLAYTGKLLAAFPPPAGTLKRESIPEPLSERELSILQLIATGHTNQEIAGILTIEVSTVKSHINHLYGKLGAHRRTQAIATARELGILSE